MRHTFSIGLIACALATAAMAQTTRPGLWEVTQKIGGNPQMDAAMAQMQQQMASMSPEQRKAMQDMMARQGMGMPSMGAGGAVAVRMCITPEMAARQDVPAAPTEGDCTSKVLSRSGNTTRVSFACQKPPSSGEGTITFAGDSAYTTTMVVKAMHEGKVQNITMTGDAKWVAASCGNVKPTQ